MATAAVVIPVYATPENHRLDFLGQTLRSVQHQTYHNLVALVVDDGSPEDVAGFVRAQHIDNARYVLRKRSQTDLKTASNALNLGIDLLLARSSEVLSRSEASNLAAVAYLHSDDLLPPESVQERVSSLAGDVAFVYGDSLIVRRDNIPVWVHKWRGNYARSTFYNFPHHTAMWTADFAKQLKNYVAEQYGQDGIFDKRLSHGEDLDVSVSSAEAAQITGKRVLRIPDILYIYRRHEKSVTNESLPDGYFKDQYRLIESKHGLGQSRFSAFLECLASDFPWALGYRLPEGVKRKLRPIMDFVRKQQIKVLTQEEKRGLEALLAKLA